MVSKYIIFIYDERLFINLLNNNNNKYRHHRQVIVDRLDDGTKELDFIDAILDEDSKNYHAWSYRYE